MTGIYDRYVACTTGEFANIYDLSTLISKEEFKFNDISDQKDPIRFGKSK